MDKQMLGIGINILAKLQKITDLYEEKDLEYILDKVYKDLMEYIPVKTSPTTPKLPENPVNQEPSLTSQKKVASKRSVLIVEDILVQLELMEKEAIHSFLNPYTVNQLKQILKALGLKVGSKENKAAIIGVISHYYGFDQLNRKIAKRYT